MGRKTLEKFKYKYKCELCGKYIHRYRFIKGDPHCMPCVKAIKEKKVKKRTDEENEYWRALRKMYNLPEIAN